MQHAFNCVLIIRTELVFWCCCWHFVHMESNRCQKKHKEKKTREGSEKREKWMSHGEGSKFTEIKDWLAERVRESNELSPLRQCTAWMVLCKSWVYTHRLPPLGGTHNMRRYLTVCMCVCAWKVCVCVGGLVRGYMCMNIQWRYLSVTFHAQDTSTHYTDSKHTNYCPELWFKRAQIICPRCKIARGIPMNWQLHWLTVTPPQYQFHDTHTHISTMD